MSHATHTFVLAHTNTSRHVWTSHVMYEGVMSHTDHVTFTWDIGHINASRRAPTHEDTWYPLALSCQIWMSHVIYERVMSHMNESCHIRMSHVTHERVMSHLNESSHIWMSLVTYEWVTSHMNESYDTWVRPDAHRIEAGRLYHILFIHHILVIHHILFDWLRAQFNRILTEYINRILPPTRYLISPRAFMSHINESCHIWMSDSHMNKSCYIWMSNVTYADLTAYPAGLFIEHSNRILQPPGYLISPRALMSHMNESCHIWIRHVMSCWLIYRIFQPGTLTNRISISWEYQV